MKNFKFFIIFTLSLICILLTKVAVNANSFNLENTSSSYSPSLTTSSLEQEAQRFYELGDLNKSIYILTQLATEYDRKGDTYRQVVIARNLAFVYLKLGDREKAENLLNENLSLIESLEEGKNKTKALAQNLEVKGQLYLASGSATAALETWKTTTELYQEIEDITGITRSKINQVAALRSLGLYHQASKRLQELQRDLQQQPDTFLKAKALQNLGDVLRSLGKLDSSLTVLQESLAIARKLEESEAIASIFMSLGQTGQLQLPQQPEPKEIQGVIDRYQKAEAIASLPELQAQAQLYQLNLYLSRDNLPKVLALVPQIEAKLEQLPPNRAATYARINFAHHLIQLSKGSLTPILSTPQIAQILSQTIQTAKRMGDKRTEAYAIGSLGTLYEQNQRWDEAQNATEESLRLAQMINAPDLAYQWHWQLGRILNAKGEQQNAIAAYSRSISLLQTLRSDLIAASSDVQYSFRDRVEPIYRELVSLLLQPSPILASVQSSAIATPKENDRPSTVSQENLKKAREVIELLHLAELDNFFRDACLDTQLVQIDAIDPTAAVFYPIILRDRLEVIVALPGQPLHHHAIPLPETELKTTLTQLRIDLASFSLNPERLQRSQTVYDWLIRPVEPKLQQHNVKTLVFVPDSLLRNIPIAALHDGQNYVVERYSVAFAPTLNAIDPQPLARETLKVLSAGLTEARQGFSALPNVALELERIEAQVPSEILRDRAFTETNFKTEINRSAFPIVHLATHGEFSSQVQDTFLLTWDDRINIEELNALLQADLQQKRPIELLVLSACQTATGDDRAALGLAGIAVRAGARSTLASLWYINDEATSILMTRFYQELHQSNITKAEALRRAQVEVLEDGKFSNPYFWSAFVLVGNWL